jgi:hypothetical protein
VRDKRVVGADIPGREKGNVPFGAAVEKEIRGKAFGESGLGSDDQQGGGLPAEEASDEMGTARTGETENLPVFQSGTKLVGDRLHGGMGNFVGGVIFVSHG